MARRRGDGPPGLIDRVRWGNVGRLAAFLAAGLLIAVGPGSCGGGGRPAAQPRGLLPDPTAAGDQYGGPAPHPPENADDRPHAVSDEEKKPKREGHERKPDRPASTSVIKQQAPQPTRRGHAAPAPRYYPRTRRYYSPPARRYAPPATHYSPPPEPPPGTPEFL